MYTCPGQLPGQRQSVPALRHGMDEYRVNLTVDEALSPSCLESMEGLVPVDCSLSARRLAVFS